MKLFYSKGSCALASHIVMAELNMVYSLEAVDVRAKTYAGGDYKQVNWKGAVPAIQLESGEILTEGAVILQYLADQKPEGGLLPKQGTLDRYRCMEWLNHIGTDIHKSFSPLFFAGAFVKENEETFKNNVREILKAKLTNLSNKMGTNEYLMGKTFTVADAYLFTVLSWSGYCGIETSQWSNLKAYQDRVGSRPSVQRALKEQGLI